MINVTGRDIQIRTNAFKNNKTIENVDCNYTRWENNSMYYSFYGCANLKNVTNINENVTNMFSTFYYCYNLVNAPEIPNSVTDMSGAFASCNHLVNAPVIPNSVTRMAYTFTRCNNLVNAPEIPNSVTYLVETFDSCNNLVNAPVIPNSVTDMSSAFSLCKSLVNAPAIPDSVTHMHWTFSGCDNLVNAPDMSNANSVINMSGTFSRCNKLENISVLPSNVECMYYTFGNCSSLVNVCSIPSTVINASEAFAECANLTDVPSINNGNNLEDVSYMFDNCPKLVNYPHYFNSTNLKYVSGLFNNCTNVTGDIVFKSEKISGVNMFADNTSLQKNVYIPFTATEPVSEIMYAWNITDIHDDVSYTAYTKVNIPEIYAGEEGEVEAYYPLFQADGSPSGSDDYTWWYNTEDNSISFEQNYDDHDCVGYPDFANNIERTINVGDNSLTYVSFTEEGYDDSGSKDGVYLKDISELE